MRGDLQPNAAILAAVARLEVRVAVLELRERERAESLVTSADRKALAAVLPHVPASLAPEFESKDLRAHAEQPGAQALRRALGDRGVKSIGRLFARAAESGVPIGGYVVTKLGSRTNVNRWSVRFLSATNRKQFAPTQT